MEYINTMSPFSTIFFLTFFLRYFGPLILYFNKFLSMLRTVSSWTYNSIQDLHFHGSESLGRKHGCECCLWQSEHTGMQGADNRGPSRAWTVLWVSVFYPSFVHLPCHLESVTEVKNSGLKKTYLSSETRTHARGSTWGWSSIDFSIGGPNYAVGFNWEIK